MAAFEFVALDNGGHQQEGVLEADTPRQVRSQLRDKGLTPLSVDAVISIQSSPSTFSFQRSRSLSATDLSLVTRQLATLVQAALPI